jgi:hypothetical protein
LDGNTHLVDRSAFLKCASNSEESQTINRER